MCLCGSENACAQEQSKWNGRDRIDGTDGGRAGESAEREGAGARPILLPLVRVTAEPSDLSTVVEEEMAALRSGMNFRAAV